MSLKHYGLLQHIVRLTSVRAGAEDITQIDSMFVHSSWWGGIASAEHAEHVYIFLMEENGSYEIYIGVIRAMCIRAIKVSTLEAFSNVNFRRILVVAMDHLAQVAEDENELSISIDSKNFDFLVAEIDEIATEPRNLPIGRPLAKEE